jgi:aminotransferase EvaB
MSNTPYNYLDRQFKGSSQPDDLTNRIFRRIRSVVKRGDFTLGDEVDEAEFDWRNLVGTSYAIGMSNGTDAIAVALEAAGLQPGDKVLTSPVSFIATCGAIIQAGGVPVFQDIETLYAPNIARDMDEYRESNDVKYAVPVLWAGNPAFLDTWNGPGEKVVVDAAQAVNALIENEVLGSLQFIYAFCYSLHPLKNINVWGDGGMIATNDTAVDWLARSLRNHGLKGRDLWERPGYNHRLSTLQAAVLSEVLSDFENMATRRDEIAKLLNQVVTEVDRLHEPDIYNVKDRHAYHLYQIVVDGDRQDFIDHLIANGVEAKVHYPIPLHMQPALRQLGYHKGDFPKAEQFCDQHVSVPVHEYLSGKEIENMLSAIKEFGDV